MTDLEQQLTDHLRRRAAAATPRYDLEGIKQDTNLVSLDDRDDRRSRTPTIRLLAIAACLLAAVGLAAMVIAARQSVDIDPADVPSSTQPPDPAPTDETTPVDGAASRGRVGVIGLPPEGASFSSMPTDGSLVMQLQSCDEDTRLGVVGGHCSEVWVYANGQVIWRFQGDLPEGANPHSTGFLEQWLTPQGVERFRSEFDTGPEWRGPSAQRRLERAIARLRDPSSWPAGTWNDSEIKPYLPARFGICFARDGFGQSVTSNILEQLPGPARDLVRGWSWGNNRSGPLSLYCAYPSRTVEEARTLAAILDYAGVAQGEEENAYLLEYQFDDGQPATLGTIHLVFGYWA